ncbi:Trp biosynthesis-associated membrane protein [Aeromicrobium endophyticum]|uniref:TIGR02234 family membrane protein n=1 Tax=Aeromicrobium endophyticum TaxID=2292704 RepID=A0A371P382_9ACTN|nr:Trp biosynthesis-associated membrane protein [Aeromicrobium endophyticum]REK70371.1 TIGR02234 family membrane protein [Aeromicrobium endophyticum]
MTPRRLYAPVVLATLAAGGLAFVAVGRTWAQAELRPQGLASADVAVSGSDAQPLVSALAVVVVAAALAILAAGPRMRRVVGGLTTVVSVAAIVLVPRSGTAALDDALRAAAEKSPAYTGPASLGEISYAPWYLLAIAAFVVAAVLGAATVRFAGAWPTMSSRYDAPSARRPAPGTSDTDMWKAMDRGDDPTA